MPEEISEQYIGFFSVYPTKDNKGSLGALLVTDQLGKPEEFRVTLPIKPTIVQKTLYGASLNRYLGIQLCGIPLYNSLKKKADLKMLVLANTEWLPLSEEVKCRVAYLSSSVAQLKVEGQSELETISPLTEQYKPLSVKYPLHYSDVDITDCHTILESFSRYIDLCEPFSRMQNALDVLASEDQRFT